MKLKLATLAARAAQFEFSTRTLNECGRMVCGWIKSSGGNRNEAGTGGH